MANKKVVSTMRDRLSFPTVVWNVQSLEAVLEVDVGCDCKSTRSKTELRAFNDTSFRRITL